MIHINRKFWIWSVTKNARGIQVLKTSVKALLYIVKVSFHQNGTIDLVSSSQIQ